MINRTCIAFLGDIRIAQGSLVDVARAARLVARKAGGVPVAIFDAATSEPIDVDLRGTEKELVARLASHPANAPAAPVDPDPEPGAPRGPGRPRLGVIPREVTLLPRHWEWLGRQSGGASAALRRLVEHDIKTNGAKDRRRRALEAAYRFLSMMNGDRPEFEEATRALFALDEKRFMQLTRKWPPDPRDHALALARIAFHA